MNFIYLVIALFVIAANVFWYRVKFVLRSRGHGFSYFSHVQDLIEFRALIRKERNPALRARYSRIEVALYVSLASAFLLLMTLPLWYVLLD